MLFAHVYPHDVTSCARYNARRELRNVKFTEGKERAIAFSGAWLKATLKATIAKKKTTKTGKQKCRDEYFRRSSRNVGKHLTPRGEFTHKSVRARELVARKTKLTRLQSPNRKQLAERIVLWRSKLERLVGRGNDTRESLARYKICSKLPLALISLTFASRNETEEERARVKCLVKFSFKFAEQM